VIVFETIQEADTRAQITHRLRCNDTVDEHAKLSLEVIPVAPPPPPPPPPPEFFCRVGCGCENFVGPPTAPICARDICRHPRVRHLPV
jgi:hypothetical protein